MFIWSVPSDGMLLAGNVSVNNGKVKFGESIAIRYMAVP